MNHVYRIVWSHARQAWVVVAEFARGRGKAGGGKRRTASETATRATLVLAGIGLLPLQAWATERSHVFTAPVVPHEVSAPVAIPAIRRSPEVSTAPVVAPDASPTGGTIVAGAGNIASSGNVTTITQGSDVLSLTWDSFDIGPDSTVTFVQPDALSVAVNRILGTEASQILGRLDANGQVFLINPYGVVFGESARVNVGGLVASTLDLEDDAFGSETLRFSGDSSAAVVNRGTLTAAIGGYVALLGHDVSNQGTIRAQLGSVALGAGSAVTLRMDGQQLVDMQVERSALDALVENRELIVADGGQVLMTAGARDSVLASVVNNTGLVQARTVGERDGRIVLLGGMEAGTTHVDGLLDASAPEGGDGGFIETSAAHVEVADSARITTLAADGDTGNWLIDPQDYSVAASGGDITGAALSANLATTNVEIQSATGATAGSGDIHVDDAVTWDADTTLTLTASNDININADLTATGDNAGLVLNPDTANGADPATGSGTYSLNRGARITLSGLNPYLSIGGNVYTVINSLGVAGDWSGTTLQGITGNRNGYYALGSDIDAGDTATWNGGAGFSPIGTSGFAFEGVLDGLGNAIEGLQIAGRPTAGLFGEIGSTGVVRNLTLDGGQVAGTDVVGALAVVNRGLIENVRSSVVVEGNGAGYVGGLVGVNSNGTIRNVRVTGSVTVAGDGFSEVGGLVGTSTGAAALIEHAAATGAVDAADAYAVGGLVGINESDAVIRYAHASGDVLSSATTNYSGGLVGENGFGSTVSNAYATGSVATDFAAGGLVGNNFGNIDHAYATGAVTTSAAVAAGGLVAVNNGTIDNVHASGAVTGMNATLDNGLVGANGGTVRNARWDTERTTQATGVYNNGGTLSNVVGLTHAQMFNSANYAGFTFTTTPDTPGGWVIVNGRNVGGLNNVAANGTAAFGGTLPMLAFEWQQDIDNVHALQLMAMDLGADYRLLADIDASATGDAARDARGADVWGNSAFIPVGVTALAGRFSGSLDGAGHTIDGLAVNAGTYGYAGLFGHLAMGAAVRSLVLANFSVAGGHQVGALVGYSEGTLEDITVSSGSVTGSGNAGGLAGTNGGSISRATADISVSATGFSVGGLVGYSADGSTIDASTASGTVAGAGYVGGLVGQLSGLVTGSSASGSVGGASSDYVGGLAGYANGFATISGSSASGNVTGRNYVGGLVGHLHGGTVTGASATSDVGGTVYVGGLVGYLQGGSVGRSWATGAVTGTAGGTGSGAGGLVGFSSGGTISQAYAAGAVQGDNGVGGLVGTNAGMIEESYALGTVIGSSDVGALAGYSNGPLIADAYWNTDTTGLPGIGRGTSTATGLTTAQMIAALPAGFDAAVWGNQSSQTTPYLLDNVGPVFVANGGTALYTPILTVEQLQAINDGLAGNYALFDDIDASATAGWNDGMGFSPLGGPGAFSGVLDGLGHTVTGLTINRPATSRVGLFSTLDHTGVVRDLGLVGVSVAGRGMVGALAGFNAGTIQRAWVLEATASGGDLGNVGGLVGISLGTMEQTFSTGQVTGTSQTGGLVGRNDGAITQSFSTATVSGSGNHTGGLAGANQNGTISQSYATGAVSGGTFVGGLVGSNGGALSETYSTGTATGATAVGGLAGSSSGTTADSYWDMQTSGQASSASGTGKTTAQMRSAATFATWDLAGPWKIHEGNTAPLLRAFLAPLTIDVDDVTVTYDGTARNGSATYAARGFVAKPWLRTLDLGLLQGTLGDSPARNAGSYTLAGGLYSGQFGYDLTFVGGTLTIDPKAITVGATASDKVYDGTTDATAALAGTGVVTGDDITFSGTATFADKHVGTGKTVTVGSISASGADAGNYTFNTSDTDTADITAKAITVALAAGDKVYDGNTTASATFAATGVVAGDDLAFSGTATFDDKNAGIGKRVTSEDIAASGTDAGNYTYNTTDTDTADITTKAITVGATAADKVYDGTTAATATLAAAGVVAGDDLAFSGSASFADKHAGIGKTVTVTGITASGADSGNYSYNATDTDTADITPKAITVDATAADKVYDGTAAATATLAATGIIAGDDLAFSGSAAFGDKHAGTGKLVTVTGIAASGSDAGNYSYNAADTDTADITPKAITVDATAADKVYDGTTAATATLAATGVIAGDDLAFSGSAAFGDKHAGSGKTVTVGVSASGADAGNYTFNTTDTDTADITPKAITVDATATDKVYDGTTAAAAALVGAGVIAGDDIAFSGAASFGDKHAGIAKTVTVTGIAASGADAGNYSYNATDTDTADITPKTITVDAMASDKVYDGTTSATATLAAAGVIAGDDMAFSGAAVFGDKHAGIGKTVTVGVSASGADAGNYTFNTTDTDTADISPKAITVDATVSDKVYDGTTSAVASLVATGVIAGDNVAFSGTAAFGDKHAGIGKTVTVGVNASGTDAGNYAYNTTDTDTADITPKAVTVDATAADKVYDGTTAATATLAATGVIAGDDLAFSGSAAFADKHAGIGKAVTVGVSASGTDAGNYSFNTTDTDTADITPKAIVVDATASDKVYDGTTSATATLAAAGVIAGDDLAFSGAAVFGDKHAGIGKTVTVGVSASGADAGNYTFNTTDTDIADISPKAITVDATAADKVYDGTTAATATLAATGAIAGDDLAFSGTAAFDDKNVGDDKTVTVEDIAANGADAGNYSFNTTDTATADVTPATLTYLAEPTTRPAGEVPSGLGGTVEGLVADESLEEATEGTLAWTTPATAESEAGRYAIEGSGLTAGNYVFVQAPGNSEALTLVDPNAVAMPDGIVAILASLQSPIEPDAEGDAGLEPPHLEDDEPVGTERLNIRIIDGGVLLP